MSVPKRSVGITAGAITLVLLVLGGGAMAALHSNSASSTDDLSSRILSSVGSTRVQSLTESDGIAKVSGTASTQGGDAARTLWYELMAGSALAETDKLQAVASNVVDSKGGTLYSSTDDAFQAQNLSADPLSSSENTSSEIEALVSKEAPGLGLEVIGVNYVALYGGTAEVVVHAKDMQAFDDSAMSALASLVRPFAQESRPYLVTFVDDQGAPQLVVGHVAGIGSETGQGVSWQAPGVNALIGSTVAVSG